MKFFLTPLRLMLNLSTTGAMVTTVFVISLMQNMARENGFVHSACSKIVVIVRKYFKYQYGLEFLQRYRLIDATSSKRVCETPL